VHTTFSFPNPLLESEELHSLKCSKILLSFLMWFNGLFWPNQQQQWCLPHFESILGGHFVIYQLPSVLKWRTPSKNICMHSHKPFVATLCSFPPSMTYKGNWLYTTSYNSYTVKDKQTRLSMWTDVSW
jgi:hypothetical protein